jgi:hypothetical protein
MSAGDDERDSDVGVPPAAERRGGVGHLPLAEESSVK